MPSDRTAVIAQNFEEKAPNYDRHAKLQNTIAASLAQFLPRSAPSSVLEFGAGTGFLTEHILRLYPHAPITITDLSPAMLHINSKKYDTPHLSYKVIDAQSAAIENSFDLIAGSMAAHWFDDPQQTLLTLAAHLNPGGTLAYSALGPYTFPEWRDTLSTLGYESGLVTPKTYPGIVQEERVEETHSSALSFFTSMKAIGAHKPAAGYKGLNAAALRAALRLHDRRHAGRFTWHIVYGRIDAPQAR